MDRPDFVPPPGFSHFTIKALIVDEWEKIGEDYGI